MTLLHIAFAGLWAVIWKLSAITLCIVAGLAFAYISPINKKWGLWFAGLAVVVLISYSTGIVDEKHRGDAKIIALQAASKQAASAAYSKGVRDANSGKHDPRDDDK